MTDVVVKQLYIFDPKCLEMVIFLKAYYLKLDMYMSKYGRGKL